MSKLSTWLHRTEKKISKAIPHQHSAERRAANQAVAEQIQYYQDAKKEMTEEKKRVEGEREREEDKIGKKKIRAARRAYRAPGFMEEANPALSDTLG